MYCRKTSVDELVARRLGLAGSFSRQELENVQFGLLRKRLVQSQKNSPFYARRLRGVEPDAVRCAADVARIPFTTVHDLREHSLGMLCVSQAEIERIITLATSGSTGPSKRVYFTRQDLDSTLDFFAGGMLTMVDSGQRVAAMLPDDTPDGVGALLRRALHSVNVDCDCVWPPNAATLGPDIAQGRYDCVAGLPAHVLELAEAFPGTGRVRSVLLCSEYIARAVRRRIEAAWGCESFMHYGSTETGLGGGVECAAHCGCHMREADLYMEVVEPGGDRLLPDGECGEIVITTLSRRGMPLIRYRTGDMGSLDRTTCICGGMTVRLRNLQGRIDAPLLSGGECLRLNELDEALYELHADEKPLVAAYSAQLEPGPPDVLRVRVRANTPGILDTDNLHRALYAIAPIRRAMHSDGLVLDFFLEEADSQSPGAFSHTSKRTIFDLRRSDHETTS